MDEWRRKFNKVMQGEIVLMAVIGCIKGQRIEQRLGRTTRKSGDDTILKWKPKGSTSKRPRRRWVGCSRRYLKFCENGMKNTEGCQRWQRIIIIYKRTVYDRCQMTTTTIYYLNFLLFATNIRLIFNNLSRLNNHRFNFYYYYFFH